MGLLIAGVALWFAAHLFKRFAPEQRAALGEKGKGLVAVTIIASVVLMVIGYRMADGAFFWGRHPMLIGVKIWALGHILVNGDVPSLILFGGLLAWAVIEVIVINRAEPEWTPPPVASKAKEIRAAVGSLVFYAVAVGIHYWLGYPTFG
jgi:uncharacterized membrane protein